MIIASKVLFKISLFGWELAILRYPTRKPAHIDNQGIQPHGVYIKREGKFLVACDKDGNFTPNQISLTLSDTVSQPSTVTVEYFFAGIYNENETITPNQHEQSIPSNSSLH